MRVTLRLPPRALPLPLPRALRLALRALSTGGEQVVSALIDSNVRTVFGIPGTHTLPIYHALQQHEGSITHVTTRHEAGAGFAADGYHRATGELAAVCVVTGIGLTNTITPMAAALADSVPMVVISSEVPAFWREERALRQYSHFVPHASSAIAASVCKHSVLVESADEIMSAVARACFIARDGRAGPVHVSIPIDLLLAESVAHGAGGLPAVESTAAISPQVHARLSAAAAKLSACERPVIIAGGGARGASPQVAALAEALDAPVLMTVGGKGVVNEAHELAAGGRLHHPRCRDLLTGEADALLLIGTQLSPTDYWQFKHHDEIPLPLDRLGDRVIHVDIDPTALEQGGVARSGGSVVCADAHAACEVMLSALPGTMKRPRRDGAELVARAKRLADAPPALSETMMWDFKSAESGGQQMMRTLEHLRAALPDDAPLVADVCRIGYTALSLYPAYRPSTFLYPVGTTALGYGLPAAVGAAIAQRDLGLTRPVAAIIGDGGLQISVQELATAAEEKLPILLLVWNDASYGEIRRNLPTFATHVPRPDMAKLCEAYGVHHIYTEDADGVAAAMHSSAVSALLNGRRWTGYDRSASRVGRRVVHARCRDAATHGAQARAWHDDIWLVAVIIRGGARRGGRHAALVYEARRRRNRFCAHVRRGRNGGDARSCARCAARSAAY